MAVVPRIVEEAVRLRGSGAVVNAPVHDALRAADGEDNGVHVIDGQRFESHGFGSTSEVGTDVILALDPFWLGVHFFGVLGCQAYQRICGQVPSTCYELFVRNERLEEQLTASLAANIEGDES